MCDIWRGESRVSCGWWNIVGVDRMIGWWYIGYERALNALAISEWVFRILCRETRFEGFDSI